MNDEVAAAVHALENSRAALADVLANTAPEGRYRRAATSASGSWGGLWEVASAAAKKGWERSALRPGLEFARPAIEDAVRRQPWTAVTVAALCGAVAIWVVSTRRRWILASAGLWWRGAGATMLAATAIKLYEQFVAAPAAAPAAQDEMNDPTSAAADAVER
jgi:hypothetical protein